MKIAYKYLFNFSSSYTGGGLKRLYEYAKWFNENGGCYIIIHPKSQKIMEEFQNNHFFIIRQLKLNRLLNDCSYLPSIQKKIGKIDFYYSYGIPIYYQLAKVNWFHLSNILPIYSKGMPLSFFDRHVRLKILGWKIKENFKNANIISAESDNSLSLINIKETEKLFLSINGNDDSELSIFNNRLKLIRDDIATVVGTQTYKAIIDSYYIFDMLWRKNNKLKMVIIGDTHSIPALLKNNNRVIITGVISKKDVAGYLKRSKYFITTTLIENSSNATCEGVIMAGESYISDIGPHQELLHGEDYKYLSIPNVNQSIICVNGDKIEGKNLKPWLDVISEMIDKVNIFND